MAASLSTALRSFPWYGLIARAESFHIASAWKELSVMPALIVLQALHQKADGAITVGIPGERKRSGKSGSSGTPDVPAGAQKHRA
jgi:hypothetical protein